MPDILGTYEWTFDEFELGTEITTQLDYLESTSFYVHTRSDAASDAYVISGYSFGSPISFKVVQPEDPTIKYVLLSISLSVGAIDDPDKSGEPGTPLVHLAGFAEDFTEISRDNATAYGFNTLSIEDENGFYSFSVSGSDPAGWSVDNLVYTVGEISEKTGRLKIYVGGEGRVFSEDFEGPTLPDSFIEHPPTYYPMFVPSFASNYEPGDPVTDRNQSGIWLLNEGPTDSISTCVSLEQRVPAEDYTTGLWIDTPDPVVLAEAGKVSWWADYNNPNEINGPVQVDIIDAETNITVEGENYYGSYHSDQPYYIPPGWTKYERNLPAGSYRVQISGSVFSALDHTYTHPSYPSMVYGGEWVGPSYFRLTGLRFFGSGGWKFFTPFAGENDGTGRGKIYTPVGWIST